MSVQPSISLSYVRAELREAEPIIDRLGLRLDDSMLCDSDLRFRVTGESRVDGERYIAEFRCDDYRELPPYIEMIDPESGTPGTRHAYPNCFNSRLCICARFNRKTYQGHTGLHTDWKFGDWAVERGTDHLGGMINHIFSHIHGYVPNYSGRRA